MRDLQGHEAAPPRTLPPLPNNTNAVRHYRGLTFSPNGQRLAYACGDVLQLLDAATLTVLYEEISRQPQCGWLDDDRLLYGFNGSVATPPFPKAGAWILNFRGVSAVGRDLPRVSFPEMCAPLAVSPDRRFFVLHRVIAQAWSWDRYLHVFQTDGDFTKMPAPLYTMSGLEYPGTLAFSRSGKYLAFSAGPTLRQAARVLEPARRQPVGIRGAHAPPDDLITRTAQDGRARFYLGHEKQVSDLVFDPTGALLTASADGTVRQWPAGAPHPSVRLRHAAAPHPYTGTTYPLFHPAASADGLRVLHLGSTNWTELCDVVLSRTASHNVALPLAFGQAPLAVLRDGRVLTQDRITAEVVLWSEAGRQLREQKRLTGTGKPPDTGMGRTRRGVLSRDEQRLAGAFEGRLFSVDLAQGTVAWSGDLGLKASHYFGLGVTRHANHDLSPDGEWIATSDFGPRITIHRFAQPDKVVATLGGAARD